MAMTLRWTVLVVNVLAFIAFGLISVRGKEPEDHEKEIMLHYTFENSGRRNVSDSSNNGRDATMRDQIKRVAGKYGKGIFLEKHPLRINSIGMSKHFTIAVWIYLNKTNRTTARKLFTNCLNCSASKFWVFAIRISGGGKWELRWTLQNGTSKRVPFKPSGGDVKLNFEVWHHFAVSYNFSSGAGEECYFFINGKKMGTKKTKVHIDMHPMLSRSSFIGSMGGESPFNGTIDEFYIFNRTLKEKEIRDVMNGTHIRTIPAPTELTSTSHPTMVTTTTKESTSTSQPNTMQTTRMESNSTSQPPIVQTTRMESTSPTQPNSVTTTVQSSAEKYKDMAKKVKTKDGAINLIGTYVKDQIVTGEHNDSVGAMGKTETLETMGLTIARRVLRKNESLSVETSSALILIKRPTSGFTFPHVSEKRSKNISETMSFPDEMVKTDDGVERAFVCMSYSDLHENLPEEFTISSGPFKPNTTLRLYSKIIGAAVEPQLNKTLANPIKISFTHAKISSGKQICSFWNHSIRTSEGKYGQWSTSGCELDREQSTSTKTVCLCNHLTNFALLLQREGAPNREPPLSLKIITIIGCTLSILACLLCFFMFLTLKKRDIRHHLHINLAFAIAVAQLILLFGISETKYQILCKALAVFLHYFYLVAFLLMLCEGVHLAILIETAFSHGDLKLPAYLIASWGLPAIIVGITFGARFDNYGNDSSCFISPGDGTVYAFVGPFALVLVINIVILFIVLRQVIRKTSLPISSKTASKFEIARTTVRSLVILFPVMGLTWIFGILFFGFRTLAFEYLFAIFCSLQGFFIFLFQYALNSENRLAFLRATRRWRLTFSSSTQTSTNWSKQGGGTDKTAAKVPLAQEEQVEGNMTPRGNCHLILYRNVHDQGSGMIDSRTTSTFI